MLTGSRLEGCNQCNANRKQTTWEIVTGGLKTETDLHDGGNFLPIFSKEHKRLRLHFLSYRNMGELCIQTQKERGASEHEKNVCFLRALPVFQLPCLVLESCSQRLVGQGSHRSKKFGHQCPTFKFLASTIICFKEVIQVSFRWDWKGKKLFLLLWLFNLQLRQITTHWCGSGSQEYLEFRWQLRMVSLIWIPSVYKLLPVNDLHKSPASELGGKCKILSCSYVFKNCGFHGVDFVQWQGSLRHRMWKDQEKAK